MFTSEQLTEGEIYTRNDLREQFNIKDATINTGVFRLGLIDSWKPAGRSINRAVIDLLHQLRD